MKSLFALISAVAVTFLVADASADCGDCGTAQASAKACPASSGSDSTCTATACAASNLKTCTATACTASDSQTSAATTCAASDSACTAAVSTAAACTAKTCVSAPCESGTSCPIAVAMERLPKLTYVVGEKTVCCPNQAAKLTEESNNHLHFRVADQEYHSKSDAQEALLQVTEKFVANAAQVHQCPTSGKTTLAGQAQSCSKTAARRAKLMQQAMSQVKLTYAVGDDACGCPVQAKKLAQESGEQQLFVVGQEKTPCEKTARLNLARAKYRAAIQALVQAQADNSDQQETTDS